MTQSERLKALGQMAAGVAHDFNNMLTVIIGNTQLMLAKAADKTLRERLEAVELREVLTNMIINALDAMPLGGQIVFTTGMEEDSVCITVSDNGSGMPKQVLDRLFDPFFSTKGSDNSGLGLSVSYGIIQRHNGSIRVDSTPGEGTTFIIQLPSSAQPVQPTRQQQELRKVDRGRVLLIDDDPLVRDILSSMLLHAGLEVETVENGKEGIESFKRGSFNLVFTDLALPGLSGWDVARAIKDLSPATPVVLITGWGRELDAGEIKSKGVDFLLTKPVGLATVANIVADALERAS